MRRGLGLAAAVLLLAPAPAAAATDAPDPGSTTPGTVTSAGTDYQYVLYTPASYRPGRPAPLLVVVHGCQTTAEQQMRANLYNPIAEREGFVVLYPDVDALGRAQPGPANQCWKFPLPPHDNPDAVAIAEMTRAAMGMRAIDSQRVYLIGMSAGGLMASIDAAAYADLYAAVGIVESAGYADWPCFTTGVGIPVQSSAQQAYEHMGSGARVVPRFVTGSDGDQAFPATCAEKALEQGLRTDNLALGDSQEGPIALTPAVVRQERKPGGYGYTVSSYRDPDGCLIGERWIIHGMPHDWPGGTSDPEYKNFTDPNAPSASEGSWAFFRRYTKDETALPCAEAPPASTGSATAPAPRRCRAGWRRVRLPSGARATGATVNGRRAAARTARGGMRVRLPAGTRAQTTVVVRARTRAGRRLTRRHTYPGCG
jgi:poly(hydroxyalkanoate) depolymerase family esterase